MGKRLSRITTRTGDDGTTGLGDGSRTGKDDPRIVAINAAMPSGTGLDKFGEVHPSRVFDVGIAEQHAVTFAAGLASEGMRPFCAIYSTFLQRAYDQVVHDVAIQHLPVRFAIDRAGYVGADGPTHAGNYDAAYLGAIPGIVQMAAADEAELRHMVATAAAYDDGPDPAFVHRDVEERLPGQADAYKAPEAYPLELPGKLFDEVPALGGELAETGPDPAVSLVDGPHVVRHPAADEHLKGINARPVIHDDLHEADRFFVLDLEKSSKARDRGNSVLEEDAVECYGTYRADTDHALGYGYMSQGLPRAEEGHEVAHGVAIGIHSLYVVHVLRQLTGVHDGHVDDNAARCRVEVEGHLIGHAVYLGGEESHAVNYMGGIELALSPGGYLVPLFACLAGEALRIHPLQIEPHGPFADIVSQ